ncbi:MAG: FG-GAP repeat domain-containing protein, partial [Longimicrobiales bacterium]
MAACARGADEPRSTLFQRVPSSRSDIRFSNDLVSDERHNIFTDNNFYAGGGVAIGDLSGDGLPDIYLVSNQGSNRLFLNKGDFRFDDVTDRAGVGGAKPWSTGVSLVDINGDGLLDIYV